MFMVFDLLHQDGRELTGRPLRDRRARLEKVVAGSGLVLPVRRLASNGFEAWAEVIAHDYEGLVAKEEASLYEAGPTRRWLKVKQQGWTDAEDGWQRRISARVQRWRSSPTSSSSRPTSVAELSFKNHQPSSG